MRFAVLIAATLWIAQQGRPGLACIVLLVGGVEFLLAD